MPFRSKRGRFVSKKNHNKVQKFIEINGKVKNNQQSSQNPDFSLSDHTYNVNPCRPNVDIRPEQGEPHEIHVADDIQYHFDHDSMDDDFNDVNENNTNDFSWKDGRRIVELGVLCDHLQKGCSFCTEPLTLNGIWSERRYGLGSLLSIKCNKGHITQIPTGKRHENIERKRPKSRVQTWDINTKLALAMVHVGIGQKKVADLFSILNLPCPHNTTLKKREREVGPIIETVAQESCKDAALEEKDEGGDDSEVTASYDAGWQKRGSGRSYGSLSGHAALIGKKTGKCLSYATRNKFCRVCEYAKQNNIKTKDHDCRKNWDGSAKAMEPDMCVSMVKGLQNDNVCVRNIVMDNDTTTIARVRSEVDPSIKKQCDSNHTMKEFTNRLYDLKNKKHHKELNPKTISHFSKCFRYCIRQNSGDSNGIKKDINAIGQHLYGIHEMCEKSWCGYLKSPETYRPQKLPYHRYLSDPILKSDLQIILQDFSNNADKFTDLGSSQANESLNNTIASKAPKAHFYSGSESNDYRVAAAIAQKNKGYSYVSEVSIQMCLSPGKTAEKRADENDRKRKRDKEKEQTVEKKRRRM